MAKRKTDSRDEKEFVAIKVMNTQKEGRVESLTTISQLREVKFIREINNPYIVQEIDILYNFPLKELAIVFEYGMVVDCISS